MIAFMSFLSLSCRFCFFSLALSAPAPICSLIWIKRKSGVGDLLTSVNMRRRKKTTLGAVKDERRLIEAVLGRLKLLWGVSPPQRSALAAQCRVMALARGEAFVRCGEPPPGLGGVAYGALKLRIVNGGRERVVRLIRPGESLSESAALLGQAAPFDCIALAASKIVVIPPAAVLGLVERDPGTARAAVLLLAERHLRLLEELRARAPQRGLQRLAAYLESVAEPVDGNGDWRAALPGTKTLLASQLGMSKETLSRLLRSLAERGVLKVSRGDIAIVDRDALAGVAAKRD